jgi:tetratricopeptide (TPR) repeat protein
MSGYFATSLIKLCQSSGLEINVHLCLEEKPTRQEQKLITLNKYVQNYPKGWKKRLELANLLYEMGNWQQAVVEYHQVIERQPQLIGVRLQLGKLLQLMKREKEAQEVYEKALFCSDNQATQHHINGLIAVCQSESEKAIIAFNLAAKLEPEKVVHWLALAQVHQQTENYQLPITNYQLPITNYQLPITNYLLPITNYLLPITNYQSQTFKNSLEH